MISIKCDNQNGLINRPNITWVFLTSLFLSVVLFTTTPIEARDTTNVAKKSDDNYEKLKIFSEVLSLIESSYVEKVDSKTLIEGAIKGLVKALDPHTTYLPPEAYKEMKVQTSGKFGGLGIEISIRDEVLTVVSPIEDTPAFNAGIKPGDKIIKIEDESTIDMSLADAVSRLRGEIGSSVNITIFREGLNAPLLVKITRDIIKVQSVKKKIYNETIGYLKIRSFSKTTTTDLDAALVYLKSQNITKIILDVRNNPGGLLNQAVEVSDRFLDNENLIVYTKGRSEDQNMRFTTNDNTTHVSYPMIILVNAGSASASEIVAGALQDLGRAVILGTSTFGKGSVQTIIPLSDGSALRLTTARYYTPSGKVIQENGIKPDIIIANEVTSPSNKKAGKTEDKEPTEKERMRRFLRERDLKKHLKGKTSIEGKDNDNLSEEEKKNTQAEKDLEKDSQLRHAVFLLSGWDVMTKNQKTNNTHLTLGKN